MREFTAKLNEIASIVGTSTGGEEFSYKPRYDLQLDSGKIVALITPDHRYTHWGNFQDKIVFWDPLRDGPYHISASLRKGALTDPINDKIKNKIPVYDLERIAITADYPSSLNTQGTVRGWAGSKTDVAEDHYPGKFLYYTQLDSGLKILLAGDAPPPGLHTPTRVHFSAHTSGRRDLIGRSIYVADSQLILVEKVA